MLVWVLQILLIFILHTLYIILHCSVRKKQFRRYCQVDLQTKTWKNINLIFPDGGTYLDGKWFSNEDIQNSGLPSIHSPITTPIRDSIDNEVDVIWYDNGDMKRTTIYSTYPPQMIDNIPPLNIYGQKIYNQFLLNNNKKEIYTYDFESDYSSL